MSATTAQSRSVTTTHLTSVHARDDPRIFEKECRSLARSGHAVALIVADGKGADIVGGVRIEDVGKPRGRVQRMLVTSRRVLKRALELDSDIYHFHDPELIPVGLALKRRDRRVIYDIHEDVPQQLMVKPYLPYGFRGIASFVFNRAQRPALKRFDALIVPQPAMVEPYSKFSKTVLVENFVDINEWPEWRGLDYSSLRLFHAGTLTAERGLFNMLNVAERLDGGDTLILAGPINDELRDRTRGHGGWVRARYLGVLAAGELRAEYGRCNIGLILYNNVGQYHMSYAVKLFEYMLNGIPVVMPNFGDWIGFNHENRCGLNVNPTNADEVIAALRFIRDNPDAAAEMGMNGRRAVRDRYHWRVAEGRLLGLYRDLTALR